MSDFSNNFINFSNAKEIEAYFESYKKDPNSVDPSFAWFFKGALYEGKFAFDNKNIKIENLIKMYRNFGHLKANLNPVAEDKKNYSSILNIENLGFVDEDLQKIFPTNDLLKTKEATLNEIINFLESIYCQTIGVECNNDSFPDLEKFVFDYIEKEISSEINKDVKLKILHGLNQAEAFEAFIQLRYPGQKRFSIEGGESFIPLLTQILEFSSNIGVKEVVIGMAHRGRLNVLANILKKPYEEIFSEFESKKEANLGQLSGDVKYHHGYVLNTESQIITLCPNPSHLEAVDPVVLGRTKAKQLKRKSEKEVLPIIIHGDASVAGQGIVYETLQMDKLDGFSNGGVIHIVINNQIGFTAKSEESRSTLYCTDIAKAFNVPVLHVNGDDVEMCIKAATLAVLIRDKFQTSVFIDYNCYRKYGHNETDEPRFTSPLLYKKIDAKESVLKRYKNQLIKDKIVDEAELKILEQEFQDILNNAHANVQNFKFNKSEIHKDEPFPPIVNTTISESDVKNYAIKLGQIPEGFQIHPKLKKIINERGDTVEKSMKEPILDFAICEQLAYASLLTSNIEVRIVGEDSRRGTFSHRHAVLVDQLTEDLFFPLNCISENQAKITVYNSLLSEYAAMGYEYGFSVENKNSLVIWEAQFGDFVNCSQVIIDQFLSSGYQKWQEENSLVLWLPHGYEGMGPEHSSARIERFLQLAAQNNLEITYPTKASQIFHLLRHQALKKHKTPMILFAPKALLRQKLSYSYLSDITSQGFQNFLLDIETNNEKVEKIIFSTGKIIWDLREMQKTKLKNVACISIERLYPIDYEQLKKIVKNYPKAKKILLVQEEPENMGAVLYLKKIFGEVFLNLPVEIKSRPASASTAAGSSILHRFEQELLLKSIIEA